MAKLYWRVKRDGKWTWISARADNTDGLWFDELQYVEEEE